MFVGSYYKAIYRIRRQPKKEMALVLEGNLQFLTGTQEEGPSLEPPEKRQEYQDFSQAHDLVPI